MPPSWISDLLREWAHLQFTFSPILGIQITILQLEMLFCTSTSFNPWVPFVRFVVLRHRDVFLVSWWWHGKSKVNSKFTFWLKIPDQNRNFCPIATLLYILEISKSKCRFFKFLKKKPRFGDENAWNGFKKTTAPTDSHMVSHCSTDAALPSLTLEIGRDPVFSRRYGRSWKQLQVFSYKPSLTHGLLLQTEFRITRSYSIWAGRINNRPP